MKKAGPFRGIVRAKNQASTCLAVYAGSGLIVIPVLSAIVGPSEYGDLTGIYLIAHLISAVVLWPGATLFNWMLLRVLRLRTWRREFGRACVAGILMMPFIWTGLGLFSRKIDPFVEMLRPLLGESAYLFGFFGLVVTFANLALAVGWALSPWRRGTLRA